MKDTCYAMYLLIFLAIITHKNIFTYHLLKFLFQFLLFWHLVLHHPGMKSITHFQICKLLQIPKNQLVLTQESTNCPKNLEATSKF